jgi:hypothetical protein
MISCDQSESVACSEAEIGKMEFNEAEFLAKLDKVETTDEFRALVDSIPLTAEELAKLEMIERQRSTTTAPRMTSKPST